MGDRFVEAPPRQAEMVALKRAADAAGERFYCSTPLDGCGRPLTVVAGAVRVPHFRHPARAACRLSDPATARDIYSHRMIQNELVRWLRHQGHKSNVEHHLDRHSRVDVFCEPSAVIEVQLSGESAASMLDRTVRYGNNVTWLFGTASSISSRDSMFHDDGLVQLVRLRPLEDTSSFIDELGRGRRIDIGLLTEADGGHQEPTWFPLAECSFDPATGLRTPAFTEAKAGIEGARHAKAVAALQRTAATREAAEREAARLARRADYFRRARPELRARPDPADTRVPAPRPLPPEPMQGPRPHVLSLADLPAWESELGRHVAVESPWWKVLRIHCDDYVWRTSWIEGAWLTGLPPHLIDPAWAALFITAVYATGPTSLLVDPSLDPTGQIVERLAAIGLIDIETRAASPHTWFRTVHDLKGIGSPFEWHQPPAWVPPVADRIMPTAID